jgi:hypothetical protein
MLRSPRAPNAVYACFSAAMVTLHSARACSSARYALLVFAVINYTHNSNYNVQSNRSNGVVHGPHRVMFGSHMAPQAVRRALSMPLIGY